MEDKRLEIKDIVAYIDNATIGELDIPELQRDFVWSPEKVKNLVDSLWRSYPIGTILLWKHDNVESRTAASSSSKKFWIIDGQQRITALSLLFGKKPYWWSSTDEWNNYFKKCDVLANLNHPKDSLEFGLPNPIRQASKDWISVRRILNSNDITKLVLEILGSEKGDSDKFADIFGKLDSISRIKNYSLYEIIINNELEDVAEIFKRLNMAGVKAKESDAVIAFVASKQPGWVRDNFNPFIEDLGDKGFEIDPAILIRLLAIIGIEKVRLKEVPSSFWEASETFSDKWDKTKRSISYIIKQLKEQAGILSIEILPSHNALIPLFFLYYRFKDSFNFNKALYWFLLATRVGRYSGSAITILGQDIEIIKSAESLDNAINVLVEKLDTEGIFTKEDFLKNYNDKYLRLILYMIIFRKEAKDWIGQDVKIGYDRSSNELNDGFKPEWHHFFPRKVLKDNGFSKIDDINSISNIVVLNEKANRVFGSKKPQDYIVSHEVSMDRLIEQFVPHKPSFLDVSKYREFLEERAQMLAKETNIFLEMLRN